MKLRNPPPPELQKFQDEVSFLLKDKNSQARSLFYFIQRSLFQFHLNSCYEVNEIINIVYLRGIKLTKSGKAIHNPVGWLRTTSYNVIREISRAKRERLFLEYGEASESKLAQENPPPNILDSLITEEEVSKDIRLIQKALAHLSEEERQIIELRTVRQLSWEEVKNHLSQKEQLELKISTLRKRGQRTLNKLREIYHQFEQEKSSD
ncbi:MAG: sigma-70 family RNA polymerase sigma factor [Oscillatoria sp. PMC 1068.18]|nr:sigma-70 family RNA polymerase sigma factor [Oscillatoria sp. PMC 1076.18]MEC4989030.1 sigma-70 family RNA polymerase sigma factor [Oscillatoria sp. PMC 1068.18]